MFYSVPETQKYIIENNWDQSFLKYFSNNYIWLHSQKSHLLTQHLVTAKIDSNEFVKELLADNLNSKLLLEICKKNYWKTKSLATRSTYMALKKKEIENKSFYYIYPC